MVLNKPTVTDTALLQQGLEEIASNLLMIIFGTKILHSPSGLRCLGAALIIGPVNYAVNCYASE